MTVPFDDLNVDFDDTEVTFDGINMTTGLGPMPRGRGARSGDGVGKGS